MSKPLTMTPERLALCEAALDDNESFFVDKAYMASVWDEMEALRAALAAAESDVKRLNAECEMLNNMLLDDREKLAAAEAKLADERKHADALADKLSILALGRINRTEVTAHFARRNAEKEER